MNLQAQCDAVGQCLNVSVNALVEGSICNQCNDVIYFNFLVSVRQSVSLNLQHAMEMSILTFSSNLSD